MTAVAAPDEGLRRAAMLFVAEEARARDALERGALFVLPSALEWEGTAGRMRAHVVVLGLSAELLGRASSTPAVQEELARALSAALAARRQNETLADLRVVWLEGSRVGAPYRDAAPSGALAAPELDMAALDAFLVGAGWRTVREAAEGASLEVSARRVTLELAARRGPEAVRGLFDALSALARRPDGGTPEVRVVDGGRAPG
ncbi:MAG: hypothetical protein KC657_37620 [Myxococcales bacterium]|nr:hypothetical protein [Myxococcales bacterium]